MGPALAGVGAACNFVLCGPFKRWSGGEYRRDEQLSGAGNALAQTGLGEQKLVCSPWRRMFSQSQSQLHSQCARPRTRARMADVVTDAGDGEE